MAEGYSENYIQQGAGTSLHAKAELLLAQGAQMSISILGKLFGAQAFWEACSDCYISPSRCISFHL